MICHNLGHSSVHTITYDFMNFGDSPKYSTQPLEAVKCLHDPYQLPTYNANDLKNVISRQPESPS